MFTNLLAQHFVHNALAAGAIVALVSGAIGWFHYPPGATRPVIQMSTTRPGIAPHVAPGQPAPFLRRMPPGASRGG